MSPEVAKAHTDGFVAGGFPHLIAGTQFPDITWIQLIAGQSSGMTLDIYVQLATNHNVENEMWEATQFPTWWMPIERTWIAFEVPPPAGWRAEDWVQHGLDMAVKWGLPNPGIYTAAWWWDFWITDHEQFKDWPLWYAFYDGDPFVDWANERFGAWEKPVWKQYVGSTSRLEPLLLATYGYIPAFVPMIPFAPGDGPNVDLNARFVDP